MTRITRIFLELVAVCTLVLLSGCLKSATETDAELGEKWYGSIAYECFEMGGGLTVRMDDSLEMDHLDRKYVFHVPDPDVDSLTVGQVLMGAKTVCADDVCFPRVVAVEIASIDSVSLQGTFEIRSAVDSPPLYHGDVELERGADQSPCI